MMQPNQLSAKGQEALKMVQLDPGEELLWEIRKHPIGLFFIYASGLFVALAVIVVIFVVTRFLGGGSLGSGTSLAKFRPFVILIGLIMAALIVLLTMISGFIYRSNVMLITSEKIIQVLYKSIFNRNISQLGVGDIEDVTVKQPNLFSRMFNYGTMFVETAGEKGSYSFTLAPDPYLCAKYVVGAHEKNMQRYGN